MPPPHRCADPHACADVHECAFPCPAVGYGDLVPADKYWDQFFVGIYAFAGVAVIAAMVSNLAIASISAIQAVVEEAKEASLAKSAQLLAAAKKHGMRGGATQEDDEKRQKHWYEFVWEEIILFWKLLYSHRYNTDSNENGTPVYKGAQF